MFLFRFVVRGLLADGAYIDGNHALIIVFAHGWRSQASIGDQSKLCICVKTILACPEEITGNLKAGGLIQ